MPRVSDLSESKYLGKDDFEDYPGGLIATISGWSHENVGTEEKKEPKYVLHFKENIKSLILKPTIGEQIQMVTGTDDIDQWKGAEITLWVDPNVSYQGKLVGGVRVKVPQTAQPAAPARARDTMPDFGPQKFDERNPPPE